MSHILHVFKRAGSQGLDMYQANSPAQARLTRPYGYVVEAAMRGSGNRSTSELNNIVQTLFCDPDCTIMPRNYTFNVVALGPPLSCCSKTAAGTRNRLRPKQKYALQTRHVIMRSEVLPRPGCSKTAARDSRIPQVCTAWTIKRTLSDLAIRHDLGHVDVC